MPPQGFAQSLTAIGLMPAPGTQVSLTGSYTPTHLKGMVINPNDPFKFDFIVYRGDEKLTPEQKQTEYPKLIKYFLASLSVPDTDQWVNLSPYEKERIIPDNFGLTEMGRDLLAQDYLLKQVAASLTNPDTDLGKQFWDEVYAKSYEKFGTTDIPTDVFNKVWITPDKAVVFEKGNAVVIIEHHLKVQMESDYRAMQMNAATTATEQDNEAVRISKQVMREVIIPAIEKEVNEGKSFAPVRQVYGGMLLATWYKRALRESILGKVYADQGKVKGIDQDPANNQQIYQEYVKAFKVGVFNMIKEDVDRYSQEMIPRKYFSGGLKNDFAQVLVIDHTQAGEVKAREMISDDDIVKTEMKNSDSSAQDRARDWVTGQDGTLMERFSNEGMQASIDHVWSNPVLKEDILSMAGLKELKNPRIMYGGQGSTKDVAFIKGQDADGKSISIAVRFYKSNHTPFKKIDAFAQEEVAANLEDTTSVKVFGYHSFADYYNNKAINELEDTVFTGAGYAGFSVGQYLPYKVTALENSGLKSSNVYAGLIATTLLRWLLKGEFMGDLKFENFGVDTDGAVKIIDTGDMHQVSYADSVVNELISFFEKKGLLTDPVQKKEILKGFNLGLSRFWDLQPESFQKLMDGPDELNAILNIETSVNNYINPGDHAQVDAAMQGWRGTQKKFERRKNTEAYIMRALKAAGVAVAGVAMYGIINLGTSAAAQRSYPVPNMPTVKVVKVYDQKGHATAVSIDEASPENNAVLSKDRAMKSTLVAAAILLATFMNVSLASAAGINTKTPDSQELSVKKEITADPILVELNRLQRGAVNPFLIHKQGKGSSGFMSISLDKLRENLKNPDTLTVFFGLMMKNVYSSFEVPESVMPSDIVKELKGLTKGLTIEGSNISPLLQEAVKFDARDIAKTEAVKLYYDANNGNEIGVLFFDRISSADVKENVGGIDMNAANLNMQIKRDGAGVPLPVSQQDLENIRIDGLVPVILDIKPAAGIPLFS